LSDRVLTDDVVAAAQQGDVEAFRTVYDCLAGTVLGYLRTKGVLDPEGLTSDVFLSVWPKLASITGGAAGLRKVVFTVAHARMVDEYRSRARRPVVVKQLQRRGLIAIRQAIEERRVTL